MLIIKNKIITPKRGCVKVYNFESFKDFFHFHLNLKNIDGDGRKNRTLHEIALDLGYSSPATLSMIANGERLPSKVFLGRLFNYWKMPALERQRITLLVEYEKLKRKGKGDLNILDQYVKLAPFHKIDLNKHKLISDWYVLVIKVLISLPDFQEDPIWIHKKLRKKVSVAQIKRSINLLIDNGIVSRDTNTGKLVVNFNRTETTHDIPSEAIRANHLGMINLAKESVEEQTLDQRQLNSLCLQFDKSKLPEAKEFLLNFVKEFNEKYKSDTSTSIYQLNLQLFEHTSEVEKS